ncbi:hypothetical protein [Actinomadura nitritigenes]|uniref:hypothetical protein n=1 Tax=Actinomadura nitritigenes TaxID=134602 RepID=UPI003D9013C5
MANVAETDKRLGRAVAYVHQQDGVRIPPNVSAQLETLIMAGRAMDFAVRLRGHREGLTPELTKEYAAQAGIGSVQLTRVILPALKDADVVTFEIVDNNLRSVEEYVGLTGTVIEQSLKVLNALGPSELEFAVLHSVEIASWAPLTQQQHLEQLIRRGFTDALAESAYNLGLSAGVNQRIRSAELSDYVVFNPYVWGSKQVPIAEFLHSLPPAERDALLGICQQASDSPGLALSAVTNAQPGILTSARKVGLIQAATVKSTGSANASQTYVFSPLLEEEDDRLVTTEAMHQRKLFVAHILFGHERAKLGGGRIMDPVVLVNALLNRRRVGPASNIATDYHLLEAQGIVRVTPVGSRAYLDLIKPEIVEGGLAWLRRTVGETSSMGLELKLARSPGTFLTPEADRANLPDQGAADEVARAAVLKLREEAQRAARHENPF